MHRPMGRVAAVAGRAASKPKLVHIAGSKVPQPVKKMKKESGEQTLWYSLFVRVPAVANGNCFFDSVRIILSRIPKDHVDMIDEHMKSKGITGFKEEGKFLSCKNYNNDYLRVLVAASIYRPECCDTINLWRLMYANACREGDNDTKVRLAHVSCIQDQTSEYLDDASFDKLYRQMRQNNYWADEFAVGMVEEYFGVRFIVINEDGKVEPRINNHPGFEPQLFILLFFNYRERHYEPLKYVGPTGKDARFSFKFEEIPKTIVDMAQRDVTGKDVPWYVNLTDKH